MLSERDPPRGMQRHTPPELIFCLVSVLVPKTSRCMRWVVDWYYRFVKCMFCFIFRTVLFQHMADSHAFKAGLPDNLGKCRARADPRANQCLSDRKGADFPAWWGAAVHYCVTKEAHCSHYLSFATVVGFDLVVSRTKVKLVRLA